MQQAAAYDLNVYARSAASAAGGREKDFAWKKQKSAWCFAGFGSAPSS